MNFIDYFSGIGGFRRGMELLHKTEPQINHQARPDWDISIIDVYNKKQLLLFIFADDIQLDIDHD